MSRFAPLACFAFCLVASLASAQDFDAAAGTVLPDGVHLGMSVAELKAARPATFDGPPASLPGGEDSKAHHTFMEVQNMGSPGHLSYWYLFSREHLIGVLQTRNLVGIDAASSRSAAQQTYSRLAQQLGSSHQQTLLRKGSTAFVPVRADVWRSEGGRAIYFIATDQEMTVAVVEASDFPLAQVFIQPDSQRFPIEEPDKRSIFDLERPNSTTASVTSAPTASPVNIVATTPDALSQTAAKTTSASSPVATSTPIQASRQLSWNVNRTAMLVVAGIIAVAITAVLIRRRK